MTINYARENVIDFTKPFMNLGIGILFKVSFRQCHGDDEQPSLTGADKGETDGNKIEMTNT